MAPKGLSLDQKREAMQTIFHDTRDVFVLKDIEKLAVKKGIISQAVKDVLQSLVDDDLVICEKIGASNYYWSFPSEASVKIENDLAKLSDSVGALKKQKIGLAQQVEAAKDGKESTESRDALAAELASLQAQVADANAELNIYKENDPEAFKAMCEATAVAKLAANRWGDNLDSLLCWCKRQFAGREAELTEFFKENGALELEYLE
ncbi:hypothetical protein FOA52_005456 [Chlamydomonas sp. UWO 241]|nr:hypothetical protein FOA52_005456 [Chlamydomonas sp. UWO 241]